MVLGLTSKLSDDSIQRNFRKILSEEEVSHRELKNEFPGYGEKHRLEKKENQKVIQTFSFLCLAIAVICGMANFMMAGVLDWFWFAGEERNVAAFAYISNCGFVGQVYRMEGLVCGFCISLWSAGSAVFRSCDRKNKQAGTGRVSVLSCSGRNCRTGSNDTGMDRNCKIYHSVSNLCRYQFPDTGSTVYLLPEGYAEGVS